MALFSSWTNKDIAPRDGYKIAYETAIPLPSSATTDYTPDLDFLKVDARKAGVQGVRIRASVSAVSGTDVDIALYGLALVDSTANAILLLDGFDLTDTTEKEFSFNLKDYPDAFLYIGATTDANESANTLDLYISYY